MKIFSRFSQTAILVSGVIISVSGLARAATQLDLGTAASYAVLGGSTVTNTGASVINGDLGVSPGLAVTGFPPGVVTPPGVIHVADAAALQAQSDITTAYNSATGQACDTDLTGQGLGGLTLTAGVYCFSTSAQLTGTLTLNAQGNPNAVFIFQIGSTLTTASASSVDIINSGQACNVFWQIGSSATLGTTTDFRGIILAQASVTLNTGADITEGGAFARTGAVTLDTNNITKTICEAIAPADEDEDEDEDNNGVPADDPSAVITPGLPNTGAGPESKSSGLWQSIFPIGAGLAIFYLVRKKSAV